APEILPIFCSSRMSAQVAPGLRWAVEMDNSRVLPNFAQLLVGDAKWMIIEIERSNHVPDVREPQPPVIEAGIEHILIGIGNQCGISLDIIEESVENPVTAPQLEIDHEHAGLEVAEALRNAIDRAPA